MATEDSLQIAEMERRKGQGMRPPEPGVALKDPAEWVKHSQAMSGPAMLFCTLVAKNPRDGEPWKNETVNRVAFEWRELLKTGGLEAAVYDISDEKAKRMLVTMHAGWNAYELRDFLLRRPELEELEWDSVKYHPEDIAMLEANRGKPTTDPLKQMRAEMNMNEGGGPAGGVPSPQDPALFEKKAAAAATKKTKTKKASAKKPAAATPAPAAAAAGEAAKAEL